MIHMLGMWLPGGTEWVVIGIIALLLFGKRLPEVSRSIGKSIVEFKKGIKGVQDDIENESESKPLQPYDKRLSNAEEELRRLQKQNAEEELRRLQKQNEPIDATSETNHSDTIENAGSA